MLVRTLTPKNPRVIQIPDEEIGARRYGTYAHAARPQAHQIGPAASQRMANRLPNIPEDQRLDLPTQAPCDGLRVYDRRIDAWTREPRRIDVCDRKPGVSVNARSEGGKPYWIVDRQTGSKMRKITALTPASAQQIASEYAINNGCNPGDAYALAA